MALTVLRERKKQRKLVIILAVLILAIIVVNYKKFTIKPNVEQISFEQITLPSKINIDFNVLDSPILKMLKPFELIGIEFNYEGTTVSGEFISGTIIASSEEDAQRQLKELGLVDADPQTVSVGRRNPFMPY